MSPTNDPNRNLVSSLAATASAIFRSAIPWIALVCLSTASCSGAAPDAQEAESVGQTGEELTGADAVARAMEWVDAKLLYCQAANGAHDYDSACPSTCHRKKNSEWDPYRSDCSGLVSWSWNLGPPGLVTSEFAPGSDDAGISKVIKAADLMPGDAVNRPSHHIMLFVAWVTKNKRATFIEEPGCSANPNYAHKFTSDVVIDTGANTIHVESKGETFHPIRYNKIKQLADYAAQVVKQSWPAASKDPVELVVGEMQKGSIDLKNVGGKTWKAGVVKLAPIPRDKASNLAASTWPSTARVSTIAADVDPGEVGHFEWDLEASEAGNFKPYFGLLAEKVVWFADSGGPKDNVIQINVHAALPAPEPELDAGATDARPPSDSGKGGVKAADAGEADAMGGTDADDMAAWDNAINNGSCALSRGPTSGARAGWGILFGLAFAGWFGRRRSNRRGRRDQTRSVSNKIEGKLPSISVAVALGLSLGAAQGCVASTETTPEESTGTAEQEVKVCAKGSTIKGIDVSSYQGTIDWGKVHGAGIKFVIAKATESTSYVDPTFATNRKKAKAAGVVVGAYHFFRANVDPTKQANHFLQAIGSVQPGELPPTLDLETTDGESASTIAQRALKFLQVVEAKTGRKPMIYTGPSFFSSSLGAPHSLTAFMLWIANWEVSCPTVPSGWSDWTIWQKADNGKVAGLSGAVDQDEYDGTVAQLQCVGMKCASGEKCEAGECKDPNAGTAGSTGEDGSDPGHETAGSGGSAGSSSAKGGAGGAAGTSGKAGSSTGGASTHVGAAGSAGEAGADPAESFDSADAPGCAMSGSSRGSLPAGCVALALLAARRRRQERASAT